MRILIGNEWKEGFLDYYRGASDYRVGVISWIVLQKIDDMYVVRPKSLRLLWNYLLEIGIRDVYLKIRSRSAEWIRNKKFISCGIGRIIEGPAGSEYPAGSLVGFVAPCHPRCVDRLVLPSELIFPMQDEHPKAVNNTIFVAEAALDGSGRWWEGISGWSSYSGFSLTTDVRSRIESGLRGTIKRTPLANFKAVSAGNSEKAIVETSSVKTASGRPGLKKAGLFGYGNYSKTIILPNVSKYFDVTCIHEVDPLQIPLASRESTAPNWDTAPYAREQETYDVFFIAGFHHTHAPLAVYALEKGASAIVEKPVVVDSQQLDRLLAAMSRSAGQLFSCFHKRYSPLNKFVMGDLDAKPGDPVNYHCMVFEVPLPLKHWYHWPNSKSRITSNGCHWLDHFLFLNGFCAVSAFELFKAGNGSINCSVTLENSAHFTMVLTDIGSARIGVQEYVELRTHQTTIRIVNGGTYTAEGPSRIMRRARVNKVSSYTAMYRDIARRASEGKPGDSVESVTCSSNLMLNLEAAFQAEH